MDKQIGQPLLRNEDRRLLTGRGEFSDDINMDGQAYATFVRSPHAHARLVKIDSAGALALPGVLAVLTGADWVADGHAPIPHSPIPSGTDGLGMNEGKWSKIFVGRNYPMAPERPRFVGEAVAMVVAESAALASEVDSRGKRWIFTAGSLTFSVIRLRVRRSRASLGSYSGN